MTVIRSYKITTDSGFAPNPYNDCLSLATCKPGIRRSHQIGQWLAGFTSQALNGDAPGEERLVYLARVDGKLELKDYYEQYPQKRPGNCLNGDNIYQWNNGEYRQVSNSSHGESEVEHDLGGKNALLAHEFYYFGREALPVPADLRLAVPKSQSAYGAISEGRLADDFIAWVKLQAASLYPGKSGKLAEPHTPPGGNEGSDSQGCSSPCSSPCSTDKNPTPKKCGGCQ